MLFLSEQHQKSITSGITSCLSLCAFVCVRLCVGVFVSGGGGGQDRLFPYVTQKGCFGRGPFSGVLRGKSGQSDPHEIPQKGLF